MPFGTGPTDLLRNATNQDELVKAMTEAKPDSITEELHFPGLQKIHLFRESQLIEFLQLVLRFRKAVRQVDLTLGDEYEYEEKVSRVPGADQLGTHGVQRVAQTFVSALSSDPNVIGLRATIEQGPKGEPISSLYIKIGKKPASGPTWDTDGNLLTEGDEEFDPRIRLTYAP